MSGARDRLIGLSRRLRKLRAMSATELTHRVRYRFAVAAERRAWTAGTLAPADRLASALVPEIAGDGWPQRLRAARHTHRGRLLLPSADARDAMRSLFDTRYRAELEDLRMRAAETRAHRFSFFGAEFEYGRDIPWQHDPVTGKAWPTGFHADVPVHRGDVGAGDVKHVWELSRMQFLVDLAREVFLDESEASLASLQDLVRSWMAGNPYATGVHWSCALEPAFRTISWIWAYTLTSDRLDDAFHLEWLTGLHDAGRFIERHLEHYSSPYNHLLGEAAALYLLGAAFPEFADAPRWRSHARDVLERRLPEQFYADGGTSEQSTFYHHASVGDYLLAVLAARRIGESFSPAVMTAIERGLDVSLALMQPDGRTPEIGGADDGKPIRFEHLPLWDFRPYLAIGAVLFDRPDFKQAAGRFHEDALWLLGPEGLATFDAMPAAAPTFRSVALPASGYFVLRSDWSGTADWACLDCGEQALGLRPDGIPNSMHGHADALSLLATLRGRRVLIDSGFYAYNSGGAWEAHFRETAAHNTARVDGRDQARHLGKMAWSHSYRTYVEGFHDDADGVRAVGAHDGYDRAPEGLTHRRAVWLRPAGYFVICDEFVGRGAHDLEVNFQFAPGATLLEAPGAVAYGDVARLHWVDPEWSPVVACGGEGPADGWVAPSLGVRVPAPRLSLRRRTTAARTHLLTILVPGHALGPGMTVESGADGSITIVGPHSHDTVSIRATPDTLVTITTRTPDGALRILSLAAPAGRVGDGAARPA